MPKTELQIQRELISAVKRVDTEIYKNTPVCVLRPCAGKKSVHLTFVSFRTTHICVTNHQTIHYYRHGLQRDHVFAVRHNCGKMCEMTINVCCLTLHKSYVGKSPHLVCKTKNIILITLRRCLFKESATDDFS